MLRTMSGVLVAAALQATVVHAQTDENFYEGKEITVIVGFNPGGTYDLYSRIAAEYLPRYIPGNPNVVVQNMPGAGGGLAANFLATQASRDGLTIGTISQASALNQVIREDGIEYDVREFNWLGRFTPVVEVTAAWHTGPVKSIEDAMETEIALSATSAGGTSHMMPTVMNEIVGTKFDIILGYQGTTGAQHAMEIGEVEGAHSTVSNLLTNRPEWLEDDMVSVLVQYSQERHPAFPDVPAMTEFAETEEEEQILSLFGSTAEIGRSMMAPPEVPEDRLAILRAAYAEMLADPEFEAAITERNLEFGPLTGEELQDRVSRTVDLPDAVVERVRALLSDDD